MTKPQSKPTNRAEAQSDRILNAAEQCFIKYGFHAASMSNICEAAEMSPGLVYRYFENKSAIIKAIIERQLNYLQSDISELPGGRDFLSIIMDLFNKRQRNPGRRMSPVLYLELIAEATRNPEIAEAVHITDAVCTDGIHNWVKKLTRSQGLRLSEAEIRENDFALQCFLDGLVIQAARNPDIDPALIEASVKRFFPQLNSS